MIFHHVTQVMKLANHKGLRTIPVDMFSQLRQIITQERANKRTLQLRIIAETLSVFFPLDVAKWEGAATAAKDRIVEGLELQGADRKWDKIFQALKTLITTTGGTAQCLTFFAHHWWFYHLLAHLTYIVVTEEADCLFCFDSGHHFHLTDVAENPILY
jgi:hypothetical protein